VVYRLGTVPYATAYRWQRAAAQHRIDGADTDALMLLEHTPVLTLGRLSDPAHILVPRRTLAERGIDVVETDRGGDVTYHGPGQLVAYPILDLRRYRKDIGWYLRRIEEVVIGVLDDYGLPAGRIPQYTGVWVEGAKVAAIGVAIRRWVTYHGVSLNVTTDMDNFRLIAPCGISDRPVTSMHAMGATAAAVEEVAERFTTRFMKVFGIDTVREGYADELVLLR